MRKCARESSRLLRAASSAPVRPRPEDLFCHFPCLCVSKSPGNRRIPPSAPFLGDFGKYNFAKLPRAPTRPPQEGLHPQAGAFTSRSAPGPAPGQAHH
jgi:hypothetical protein